MKFNIKKVKVIFISIIFLTMCCSIKLYATSTVSESTDYHKDISIGDNIFIVQKDSIKTIR